MTRFVLIKSITTWKNLNLFLLASTVVETLGVHTIHYNEKFFTNITKKTAWIRNKICKGWIVGQVCAAWFLAPVMVLHLRM